MLETLNWLRITTLFIAGYSAFSWGKKAGEGIVLPAVVGSLAFVGLIAIWYALFQFTGFPYWLNHFD